MKPIRRSPSSNNPSSNRNASLARRPPRRCLLAGVWFAALLAPTIASATCAIDTIDQKTVVTATVVLGLSERCEAPIPAFPAPFTCATEVIGTRSGGNDSSHLYDTDMPDMAACSTNDGIEYCYADGAPPPSEVAFRCVAEIRRVLLDLSPASAQSSCGCASLKQAGR